MYFAIFSLEAERGFQQFVLSDNNYFQTPQTFEKPVLKKNQGQ